MENITPYTDWQPFMKQVIDEHKPGKMLEFGLGLGTQFLLENVPLVYSLELLCNPDFATWYGDMQEKYKDAKNWKSYIFRCEDRMTGMVKLQAVSHIKRIKPDLAFVDPGTHFRGDLVNLCMRYKVPLIVAHDTKCGFDRDDIYGWGLINPEGYETIEHQQGQGTTLWKLIQ